VFPGLLRKKERKSQQQILQTANSISEHQPRRAPLNAQQRKLCVECQEKRRWQLFPLHEIASQKAYIQIQGSKKITSGIARQIPLK